MLILDLVTTLSVALMIGIELCVAVFIDPILNRLDPLTQAEVLRHFARRLGKAMPFWYGANLVLLIAESILRRGQLDAVLLYCATALWALAILMTLLFLVPINNRMMRLNGAMSDVDRRDHQKWDTLHRSRIIVLTVAALCSLIAMSL
jgi:uncharacterized membrane protein